MQKKGKSPKESRGLDFRELDRMYRPKILRFLSGMVGETDAEEVVQDVFLKVSRGLKDFQGRSRVSTWIYRIASNAAIDYLRKPTLKRRTRAGTASGSSTGRIAIEAEAAAALADEKALPAEISVIQDEMLRCLRDYIDKLPATQRAVVVLSFIEGLKNAEISRILGLNIQTVKIRLHRGRTRLIKDLESHCGWFRDARSHLTWDGMIRR